MWMLYDFRMVFWNFVRVTFLSFIQSFPIYICKPWVIDSLLIPEYVCLNNLLTRFDKIVNQRIVNVQQCRKINHVSIIQMETEWSKKNCHKWIIRVDGVSIQNTHALNSATTKANVSILWVCVVTFFFNELILGFVYTDLRCNWPSIHSSFVFIIHRSLCERNFVVSIIAQIFGSWLKVNEAWK